MHAGAGIYALKAMCQAGRYLDQSLLRLAQLAGLGLGERLCMPGQRQRLQGSFLEVTCTSTAGLEAGHNFLALGFSSWQGASPRHAWLRLGAAGCCGRLNSTRTYAGSQHAAAVWTLLQVLQKWRVSITSCGPWL